MTIALNHFLYMVSTAGGIFAIGLSLLLLAVIAVVGGLAVWGWLTNPTPPAPKNAALKDNGRGH